MKETWSGDYVSKELAIAPPKDDEAFKRLLGMALRKNKKRAHLLVSHVLGKHIPQKPSVIEAAAYGLAEQVSKAFKGSTELENNRDEALETLLKVMDGEATVSGESIAIENATVFGYAETATCLGALVAKALESDYIHSTRYPVEGSKEYGGFSEDHSHAAEHHITPNNVAMLDDETKTIILVDDELTTGNTVMNTIRLFESHSHHDQYFIATLTDLRTHAALEKFKEFEQANKIKVTVVSLISTELHIPSDSIEVAEPLLEEIKNLPEESFNKDGEVVVLNYEDELFAINTGVSHYNLKSLETSASKVVLNEISPNEKVLVLGVEEDMFFALMLSKALELRGVDAYFSSTTQSPVLAFDNEGYAIRDRIKYSIGEQEKPRFTYNVGSEFDRIVIVFEHEAIMNKNSQIIEELAKRANVVTVLKPEV